ncbi:GNAT family N-acetyltransferase [Ferdinandcohnia quinoae]|uniref:GNAT family N-acetyltransferase n=1 Tax=Fredinandcohnia quinoae TaxID=2918902 RepID=A0AAW5E2E4_9BACI|nr:GNAT family N-acetyltransferase [Fredinandcohnia sp. SECRCQ15]MCH1624141.1 GNAT family N-acetyltransferase [Fredinandcohnia sp. SECRCQ15]
MIEIKRLSECSLNDGVKAWNDGFKGYYFDATTTVENFINRLVAESLSPTLSVVAYRDGQPIGIVLNGIRTINGKKIAWNGGTGIATSYRRHGIGKALIEKSIEVYKEEGVEIATLEAISTNTKAISLYEKLGYKIVDQLEYLEIKENSHTNFDVAHNAYTLSFIPTQSIANIPFYNSMNPWQTQWQSAKESEAITVIDNKRVVGYAYYRKVFDKNGVHEKTVLFQCTSDPDREDSNDIIKFMLNHIFGNEKTTKVIPNLPVSNSRLTYQILIELGFQAIAKQVFMIRQL